MCSRWLCLHWITRFIQGYTFIGYGKTVYNILGSWGSWKLHINRGRWGLNMYFTSYQKKNRLEILWCPETKLVIRYNWWCFGSIITKIFLNMVMFLFFFFLGVATKSIIRWIILTSIDHSHLIIGNLLVSPPLIECICRGAIMWY